MILEFLKSVFNTYNIGFKLISKRLEKIESRLSKLETK